MDPDANLAEQRRLVAKLFSGDYTDGDVQRFAELVNALDRYIVQSHGGSLPKDWRPDGKPKHRQ